MTECSFCHKTNTQVQQMIAGPDVYICNECVDICSDTIHKSKNISSSPSFEIMEQTMYCALLQNYDERTIKEMTQWIDDNITDSWLRIYNESERSEPTYKIFFNSESDLIAFKLRWI